VPPLSATEGLDIKKYKQKGGEFLLVPCCNDCNLALGAKRMSSPEERMGWLWGHYANKFQRLYNNWPEDELKELGRTLRIKIEASKVEALYWRDKVRKVEQRLTEIQYD
jgi:hypothetical protein